MLSSLARLFNLSAVHRVVKRGGTQIEPGSPWENGFAESFNGRSTGRCRMTTTTHSHQHWADKRGHVSTTNLLNGLNLPAPSRSAVVKVVGNGVQG